MLAYGQQFFLDMGTGTTADNIYQIENLSHIIGPTGYKCQMTLRWVATASAKTIRGQLKQQLVTLTEAEKA